MSFLPLKHLAAIAAAVFVLAASLLMISSSGYDGGNGAEAEVQTVDSWDRAQAVIIDISSSPDTITYYASIQDAVNAALENAEAQSVNAVTIYVKQQEIQDTIDVRHVQVNNSMVKVTIKGIDSDPPTGTELTAEPGGVQVTLSMGDGLAGPMFYVEGGLILDRICITGARGSTVDSGAGSNSSTGDAESDMQNTAYSEYNGVTIYVRGGFLEISEGSTIESSVSDYGVITSITSRVDLKGGVSNIDGGYEVYALFGEADENIEKILNIYPYVLDPVNELDVYIGYEGGPVTLPLNGFVNIHETTSASNVSIDITLGDGIPPGTLIIYSEVNNEIVLEKDNLGWISEIRRWYCFSITPVSNDFVEKKFVHDDNDSVNNCVITLKKGDTVFSGITNEEGVMRLDPNLQGIYNLFLEYAGGYLDQYQSVVLDSGTTIIYANEQFPPTYVDDEVEIYFRSLISVKEGAEIRVTGVSSNNPSVLAISEQLSSRHNIFMFVEITVENIQAAIFSLEIPQGIDPDQAIVFREHTNDDGVMDVSEIQRGDPYAGSGECFTVESIGGKNYVTIRAEKFSVYALGYESPAPSPPP